MKRIVIISFEEVLIEYIRPHFLSLRNIEKAYKLKFKKFRENFSYQENSSLEVKPVKKEKVERLVLNFKEKGFDLALLYQMDTKQVIVDAHNHRLDLSPFKVWFYVNQDFHFDFLQKQGYDLSSSFLISAFLKDYFLGKKHQLNIKLLSKLYSKRELQELGVSVGHTFSSFKELELSIS